MSCDLGIGEAFRDRSSYLTFSDGKAVEGRSVGRFGLHSPHCGLDYAAGDARGNNGIVVVKGADGGYELICSDVFQGERRARTRERRPARDIRYEAERGAGVALALQREPMERVESAVGSA